MLIIYLHLEIMSTNQSDGDVTVTTVVAYMKNSHADNKGNNAAACLWFLKFGRQPIQLIPKFPAGLCGLVP
jgi:hypothetical protein